VLKAKVPFTNCLIRRQFEVSMSEIGKLEGAVREASGRRFRQECLDQIRQIKIKVSRYFPTESGTYFSPTGSGD